MHGGCGLLALTMTSREFYDYRKGLRDKFWCIFKDEGSINFKKLKWLPFYDDAKINKCVLL